MRSRNLGRSILLFGALALMAAQSAAEPVRKDASGDPLPAGALARMGTLRWLHGDTVTYVAFTPDGKAVLTACRDNTIRLSDRTTGKEIRRFTAKPGQAPVAVPGAMGMAGFGSDGAGGSRVALSKDGKVVAAILNNAAVQLWDVETGKEIRRLDAPKGGVESVLFAPDGKSLALRSANRSTFVIEAATGKEILQIKAKVSNAPMAFAIINGPIPTADGLAFSSDGKMLATSESETNMQMTKRFVRITEIQTGKEIRQIPADNGVASIAYSPDGKTLAFGNGSKVHLHEAGTGKEIRQLDTNNRVSTVAFAPNGKLLAIRGLNKIVCLFDLKTGNRVHEFGMFVSPLALEVQFYFSNSGALETRDLAFAPDSQAIAVGGAPALRFWSTAHGNEMSGTNGHRAAVTAALLAPDGKTLISHGDDHVIRRWDPRTGKELSQFREPAGAANIAFAPDGQTVAIAGTDGMTRLLATADGKELHKFKSPAGSASLAFSADGKTLAARGATEVRLFDVAKGHEIKQMIVPVPKQPAVQGDVFIIGGGGGPGGQGFVFSPDGQTLASYVGPNDPKIVIWDIATGKELRPIALPAQAVVTNLVYSPDGRLLAAQNADQTVTLWEIASGKERAVLGEPQPVPRRRGRGGFAVDVAVIGNNPAPGQLAPLAFSRDGALLAARGPGNTVRVWQIQGGKELGVFKGHDSIVNAVAFAADGKTLVSASADTTLLAWDMTRLKREPRAVVDLEIRQIEKLWADLAGSDGIKAGQSIQTLACGPQQTAAFLGDQLKPTAPVDVKKLNQWIADLESGNFGTRNSANGELEKLGDLAIPALRKVLATKPTLETQRRVESLVEKLTTGVLTAEQVRQVRAIEVLESLGTADARRILETLSHGAAGALQTRHAQAALDRMSK